MELCNKGCNSYLKNLLVKHQNNSVYCHRWRLLSGVSLICFYGIILEIFLAELYGWLTPDERAFARLYPWNHEVAIFLGRRRESEVIYRKNCTCRGCFARSGLNTHPTPRGNWVFILYFNFVIQNKGFSPQNLVLGGNKPLTIWLPRLGKRTTRFP